MTVLDTELPAHRESRPSVITRVTQVLDTFMRGHEVLLLDDITVMTGLPRSTAFRILDQLVDLDWVERGEQGYRLGQRAAGMGVRTSDHGDLRSAAAPVLNDLHRDTGGVAHLTVLEGDSVHYLDKIGGLTSASVPSRVGARHPAYRTVSGRALLAQLSPEDVEALVSMGAIRGPRTVDVAALHRELDRTRNRHGVAVVPTEKCTLGIGAVAAPVPGPSGAIGAISLSGPDLAPVPTLVPLVVFAARRTSQRLFPNWSGSRATRRAAPQRGRTA